MEGVTLWHGDCLELMKNIPDGSIDLVLCDLPYAVTDFSWDVIIPCDKLFAEYRRVLKQNANIVLFCQQPFTTTLINGAFKTEFSHSLVWKKNNKTRAKSSKTVPLSSYEEIIVFRVNKVGNKSRHKRLREYFTGELAKCGYSVKELEELIPNRSAHHWFRFSSDFRIPTEMSEARRGKPLSLEHCKKLSEVRKGKTFSEEHKRNLGNARRGKRHTEETKARIRSLVYGENSPCAKEVFQYTKDGCFVARWGCINDASRNLKIDGSGIGKCCNGKRKNAGGFLWTFEYRGEKYC